MFLASGDYLVHVPPCRKHSHDMFMNRSPIAIAAGVSATSDPPAIPLDHNDVALAGPVVLIPRSSAFILRAFARASSSYRPFLGRQPGLLRASISSSLPMAYLQTLAFPSVWASYPASLLDHIPTCHPRRQTASLPPPAVPVLRASQPGEAARDARPARALFANMLNT